MKIRVNGIPAPQGSKRHVGGGRMIEVSKAVGPWREAVRAETQAAVNGTGPERGAVSIGIWFYLSRPAGHYSTAARSRGQVRASAPTLPDHRPDLDKLIRAVLDGLTAGGAFADDCQVVHLSATKEWADDTEPAGARIQMLPASGEKTP